MDAELIVRFDWLKVVIMNFCFWVVCLFTTLLMATHALSQDLSGWSDKTVCRQLLNNPDNTDYLEEGASRSLNCASGTKTLQKMLLLLRQITQLLHLKNY